MEAVNEKSLVKLGPESESSEWLPVKMCAGSSKREPSLAYPHLLCYCSNSRSCSELWFPAGDIHGPDKQNKVSWASVMMNENDKAWRQKSETGPLQYSFYKDKSSERNDPHSSLEPWAFRNVSAFQLLLMLYLQAEFLRKFCSPEWGIIPFCPGQSKETRSWWLIAHTRSSWENRSWEVL